MEEKIEDDSLYPNVRKRHRPLSSHRSISDTFDALEKTHKRPKIDDPEYPIDDPFKTYLTSSSSEPNTPLSTHTFSPEDLSTPLTQPEYPSIPEEESLLPFKPPKPSTPPSEQLWLQRSEYWKGIPRTWSPIKVLGKGSYGIVGLFQYIGDYNPSMPNYMVVKQSPPGVESAALYSESRKLQQLLAAGAEHVIMIYKSFHWAAGTGADREWDPSPWVSRGDGSQRFDSGLMVGRIYLEYAEKGDLSDLVREIGGARYPDEDMVWRLLSHLAKGAQELERGNKTNHPAGHRPIVHFDMRPHNVLVCKDDSGQYVFKLADFGLAAWLPVNTSDPKWIESVAWRGAPSWLTPEQGYKTHPQRSIGSHSNIWSIGATVNGFLNRSYHPEGRLFVVAHQGGMFTSQEPHLLVTPYSTMLKLTLLQCLAFRPRDRLSADDIIRRSEAMLNYIEKGHSLKREFFHLVIEDVGSPHWDLKRSNVKWKEDDSSRAFIGEQHSTKLDDVDRIGMGKQEGKETFEAVERYRNLFREEMRMGFDSAGSDC